MIRPATILSVSLFAAFALILIAVLSTPVVKGIPLGSFDDVTFGVFGFCEGSRCSGIEIGYDPSGILNASESSFDLPSSVRNSLTTILIIHPVAAFLMLVQFIMAVVSHLHSPGHSTLYLLIFFIVSVIGFLVCLLAFIVDVLLFVPHLAWGSYLVVAATVLAGLSSVFICAMRRTLISRKHRKKRIAENAEMSGENYYNREAQKAVTLARQPTMPSVSSGANGGADALPTFATFGDQNDEKPAEERIPLTRPSPSDQSAHLARANTVSPVNGLPYAEAMSQNPQDQFGNPMGPSAAEYAALRRGPPVDHQFHARGGRGGMPPPGNRGGRGGYGRGGYGPPPGRGAYGGPGRGGYGPPGRGGYGNPRGGYGPPRGGPGGMRGGGQPPYQGGGPYRGVGPYQGGGQAPYQGGGQPPYQNYQNGAGSYDRRPSPSNAYAGAYGRGPNDPYNNTANAPANGYGTYGSDVSSLPRAESPPALSNVSSHPQSVAEMDATPAAGSTTQIGTIRDSDTDVAGMVALQQPRGDGQAANVQASDASTYSNEDPQGQYVPPRANWNQGQGQGRQSPAVPSPLATGQPTQTQGRSSPDNGVVSYYEDVDPRYAAEPDNRNLAQPRYDNGFQDPSPQWAGNYGGRPTPQNSNPDFQNRTGAPGGSPPPGAPGRQYHGF